MPAVADCAITLEQKYGIPTAPFTTEAFISVVRDDRKAGFVPFLFTPHPVIGMSDGGWLATQLALHAPEHPSHLVLLTPAATLAPLPLQWWIRMLTPVVLRSPRGTRHFLQWMSSTPDAHTDPALNLIAVSMPSSRLRRVTPPSVAATAVFSRDIRI